MGLWAQRKASERRNNHQARNEQDQKLETDRWNGHQDAAPAHVSRVEIIQQAIQESRGRSPSKRRRDRERFENFEAQRRERLELFGYVKTKNGITLTIEKASAFLAKGELRAEDIAEWFNPSSFRDVVNSLGEVDAIRDYPALGITKGTVLLDPKIRVPGGHTDPALKRT